MMFETATLVRLAPWLTSVIFLWSLLSGLLGGQWIHHDRCTVTLCFRLPDTPPWHSLAQWLVIHARLPTCVCSTPQQLGCGVKAFA